MRKLYSLYYASLPIRSVVTDDRLYILNDAEVNAIKKREHVALLVSAFYGAMGVVLLIIPQYYFPWIFPKTIMQAWGRQFELPLIFWAYSVLLVYIELVLLTLLNIWCAHEVAVATGFLNYDNKYADHRQKMMIDIGLEKKNKQILKYGIDPLQQANRKVVLLWNLMFMLKATLSNFVFKLFIERVCGRYAARVLKDIVGIPIFAFWDAFATYSILNKAKIIIMGQNFIEGMAQAIYKAQPPTESFKLLLYDTMQYIAISKRDFHENHYLLTKNLFELYDVTIKEKHLLDDSYLQRLETIPGQERKIVVLLIIAGFLLDGKISAREKRKIRLMNEDGILKESEATIERWAHDFMYGKGLDELLRKYIGNG
ncbi:MAG: hypothetical protein J0I41_23455 [Filimonas sp.]|nr:hypothetical protein [Filimonas sp.]